ncbi:MAG TPA: tripartite tricarboxylate transporter substrate binding protein [Xanthobacteraceae bacterium]|jgi:tripartite-type tricarboxylate transporter receptor subunit TctC
MKLPRRQFLHLAAGAAALSAVPSGARAQTYPARPVHLICPFAAGGPNDITARLIGQALSERLGQPFVIDNRTGAGANVGTEAVVRAPADGYTLLLASSANAVNATLYDKLSYDYLRDIAPVASILRVPNVMVVNPSVPATTLPEFIAYAKANPGKLNMATSGNGSTTHVSGELFKELAGVDLVAVAYRGGGPALIDLLAGQMQVMFEPTLAAIEYIRAGKLRALAVTTATRSEQLPDIPTVAEFVPGYEASQWYGIGAPKNTPAEIVTRLNTEINAALADPKLQARFNDLGGIPTPMTPAEFGKFVADETVKWGKVVRAGNIKPE